MCAGFIQKVTFYIGHRPQFADLSFCTFLQRITDVIILISLLSPSCITALSVLSGSGLETLSALDTPGFVFMQNPCYHPFVPTFLSFMGLALLELLSFPLAVSQGLRCVTNISHHLTTAPTGKMGVLRVFLKCIFWGKEFTSVLRNLSN